MSTTFEAATATIKFIEGELDARGRNRVVLNNVVFHRMDDFVVIEHDGNLIMHPARVIFSIETPAHD